MKFCRALYSIKPSLEQFENRMYHSVAFLVRWIDFDSKGVGREMPQDRVKIADTIRTFEMALAEVVRLVYQCQLPNAHHQRRYGCKIQKLRSYHFF